MSDLLLGMVLSVCTFFIVVVGPFSQHSHLPHLVCFFCLFLLVLLACLCCTCVCIFTYSCGSVRAPDHVIQQDNKLN
jgi:hypothetical protein